MIRDNDEFLELKGNTLYVLNKVGPCFILDSNRHKIDKICFKNTVRICPKAFENFNNIKSLILPETIKHIGGNAFFSCRLLTNLDMSMSNVRRIGNNAFAFCNLQNITFNSSFEEIGDCSFTSNPVEKITFPRNLKILHPNSFERCQKLKTIDININTKVEYNAFRNCINLQEINIYDNYGNIVYRITCNEDEYIKGIESFDYGFIIIKTNKTNDKDNKINILCDNQSFEYKTNKTRIDIKDIKSLICTKENISTFNTMIEMLCEKKNDFRFISDVSYFSKDLNKTQKFFDMYNLIKSFINSTTTISERNKVLSLLDEINLFGDNNENMILILNMLHNLSNESYRQGVLQISKLIDRKTCDNDKIKIAQSTDLAKYDYIIQCFDI